MKSAVYLRVSSTEQEPDNQREACVQFAQSRGYVIVGVYVEHVSGWKDVHRQQYELIKQKAHRGEIQAVICWRLDRWVRNRDTLLEDVTALRRAGCKLHSVQEQWLESINIEGSLGKTIQEFLLGLMGSLAEMESEKRSERVKLAMRKDDGVTKSYRGKKWGRKRLDVDKELVHRLRSEKRSIRDIAERIGISTGSVMNILRGVQKNTSVDSSQTTENRKERDQEKPHPHVQESTKK